MWRKVLAGVLALLAVLGPGMPVVGQSGPWYDVTCPTGSAQVVLDPGHGGPDPGAVQDTYGLHESILTLEVADRTAALLRDGGYAVALTRDDGAPDLANSERGEIANACNADVFVEIHLNASLEATTDIAQAFWAVKEKDYALSRVMSDALATLGIPVQAPDRFDNGGLLRAKMPSVLVEAVFLTSGPEATDLANGTRQESIARAIAAGIDAWLSLDLPDTATAPHMANASPVLPSPSPVAASPGADRRIAQRAFPVGVELAGNSQAALMTRRWRWQTGLAIGLNPGQDVTGALCGEGQDGSVFFMPSNLPPCAVPSGTRILVPLAGGICTRADLKTGEGLDDLVSCADQEANRYTAIRLWVDGVEVLGVGDHRISTGVFSLDLPSRNILCLPEGATDASAAGYQAILPPLSPGRHEIVVHVELVDGTVFPDAMGEITVAERH